MSTNNEHPNPVQKEEITLSSSDLTLYVSPWGASLRGLVANGVTEIITRYHGADKVGGQGDVLIPFPGRIRDGKYTFEGVEYQLTKNDGEGPNAIHGFLRSRPWDIIQQTNQSVTFGIDISGTDTPGYPFPLHIEVTYEVNPAGIDVHYVIKNTGTTNAPAAAGFHPYFTVGSALIDDMALTLPFNSYLIYDSGMLPTGALSSVSAVDYDFREERLIGPTKFNTCFVDPIRDSDGNIVINLRSSDAYTSVRVILGPDINYVVLYSGDPLPESHRRKSLAIEPMSGGSDAFNHPQWGLSVIKPGESAHGHWAVKYQVT
jgi:aldose 1-epimerase